MSMLSDLAATAMELLPAFLADFPQADTARFEKGVMLWRSGGIYAHDAASGCYRIRCEHPERTNPGDSTAYWAHLAGPRSSRCDCADWSFRGVVCKHLAAAWLYQRLGEAPRPGQHVERDPDYEAWSEECHPFEEPPDVSIFDVAGHLYNRAYGSR